MKQGIDFKQINKDAQAFYNNFKNIKCEART